MEICIVVSVYFWYCFIYWADTSLLSYIFIYIWQSQRSVAGRIHVARPCKYCLETTRDLGSQSQVFGHVQNSLPQPFSCFLLARSLPINKNQRATVFHLIFCIFILSNYESTKRLLKTCMHLPSTAEPGSWKCSKTSLEPILLILLFPITKTCRALVWDLLAILPHDWSYTGRNMVVSPRVTKA